MTTLPTVPPIRTPSALIACCAPLLGFEPDDSVVAFVNGVPGRPAPVLARLDLGDGRDRRRRAKALVQGIADLGGRDVHLVAWSRSVPDYQVRKNLVATAVLQQLDRQLARLGVPVEVAVTTNGRVMWWHCSQPGCCQQAEALDAEELTRTRAEFVYAGYAPLGSREELAASLRPDPARAQEVAELLAAAHAAQPPDAAHESTAWRAKQTRQACRALVPSDVAPASGAGGRPAVSAMSPSTSARLHRALADVGVRDAVLLQLVRSAAGPAQWRATCDRFADLVRSAPEGAGAPAATLLAVCAWMRGDGALALIALDVARRHDPDYRLAGLLTEVIARGLDPARWRASFADLTEEQCWAGGAQAMRPRQPLHG